MRLRFQIAISVFIAILVGHTQTKPTDTGFVAGPAPAPAPYGPPRLVVNSAALMNLETPAPDVQESNSEAGVRTGRHHISRPDLKEPRSSQFPLEQSEIQAMRDVIEAADSGVEISRK
jgi:hypothetical protein